jgi:repressor LexA
LLDLGEHLFSEQVFDFGGERTYALDMSPNTDPTPISQANGKNNSLTDRQKGILDFIVVNMRERGYPPSVREIGEAVGLSSSATVPMSSMTYAAIASPSGEPV